MRVAKSIVLEAETQGTLEQQACGRSPSVRVAQRSRIVLLAADRLPNEQIAAQMKTAPHGSPMAGPLSQVGYSGLVEGCCAARTDPVDCRHGGRRGDREDHAEQPCPRHPLVAQHDGPRGWHIGLHGRTDLAGQWAQAASRRQLQSQ